VRITSRLFVLPLRLAQIRRLLGSLRGIAGRDVATPSRCRPPAGRPSERAPGLQNELQEGFRFVPVTSRARIATIALYTLPLDAVRVASRERVILDAAIVVATT